MKLLAALSLAFVASLGVAQGHNANPASAKLKDIAFILGSWSGKQNFQMGGGKTMAANITSSVTAEVGERFIQEKTTTTLPDGGKGSAIHMIGYDAKSDMYRVWWFNDTSPIPQMLQGSFDGTRLVMNTPAGAPGPTFRATYAKAGPNTWNYRLELKQGEDWRTLFITDYSK
jgi:hypothetical protein